jgi:DNA polymerase III epsilon subunit-like protein
MKQIRFWAQPIGDTELTTTLTDEAWSVFQQRIDNGESANNIFQDIWDDYKFEVGMTRLVGHYEAFDFETTDCDCEDSKKRVIEKYDSDGGGI